MRSAAVFCIVIFHGCATFSRFITAGDRDSHNQNKSCRQHDTHDPFFLCSRIQHIVDPRFHPFLIPTESGGKDRSTPSAARKAQHHSGVDFPFFLISARKDNTVTGKLHIIGRLLFHHMDHRIEPIDAAGCCRQHFQPEILFTIVAQLVGHDQLQLPCIPPFCIGGQDQPRTDQPGDHGAGNCRALTGHDPDLADMAALLPAYFFEQPGICDRAQTPFASAIED